MAEEKKSTKQLFVIDHNYDTKIMLAIWAFFLVFEFLRAWGTGTELQWQNLQALLIILLLVNIALKLGDILKAIHRLESKKW